MRRVTDPMPATLAAITLSAVALAAFILVGRCQAAGASAVPAKPTASAKLHGDTAPQAVRLAWEIRSWPDNLRGFDVKRRPSGRPGAPWERLTARPVVPEISATKDLTDVESDPAERERLQAVQADLVKRGQARTLTAAQFHTLLHTASPTNLQALRRETLESFDHALMIGLGYVDRQVAKDDTFEYGLFPA